MIVATSSPESWPFSRSASTIASNAARFLHHDILAAFQLFRENIVDLLEQIWLLVPHNRQVPKRVTGSTMRLAMPSLATSGLSDPKPVPATRRDLLRSHPPWLQHQSPNKC